jgi:hypothetical protein
MADSVKTTFMVRGAHHERIASLEFKRIQITYPLALSLACPEQSRRVEGSDEFHRV